MYDIRQLDFKNLVLANYKSYHTGIKTCYSFGLENEILPESFTESIPRSTAFYWKDPSISNKYIGSEYVAKVENNLDDIKLVLDSRVAKMRVAFISFLRFYITIINFIGKDNFKKIIKDNRNTIVNFIEKLPNEIWHMDVSYFKTTDNIQYYIYAVIDNFSRKIVSYHLSKKLRASLATQTLRNAVEMEFNTNIGENDLELIVDGGSENNNKTVGDFIQEAKRNKSIKVNIEKKVVLKDVFFSNSVIEGMFRTLKRSYFR